MTQAPGPLDWALEEQAVLADYGVFRVRKDSSRSPRTARKHDFFILEGSSWINIVALTPAGDIVLIRQFRHGTRSVTLEIPGGCIDESDASPLHAARRELLEETGFASDDWSEIGKVHPNPAIQSNTCYTFLARNAVRLHEPQPDGTEDIYVELAPVEKLDGLVLSGEITHGLVVVALHFFRLHREKAVA